MLNPESTHMEPSINVTITVVSNASLHNPRGSAADSLRLCGTGTGVDRELALV